MTAIVGLWLKVARSATPSPGVESQKAHINPNVGARVIGDGNPCGWESANFMIPCEMSSSYSWDAGSLGLKSLIPVTNTSTSLEGSAKPQAEVTRKLRGSST